jgi:Kef-type K+ transport system membrane component KefB
MAVLAITTDWSFLQISGLTLIGAATIVSFYVGRLARMARLPSLIGYMLVGVILGPSVLHLFNEPSMERLSFITEIALGFVAFSIGSELNLSSLKRLGGGIISIILAESFGAFIVVFLAVYALTRDLPLSLIFGSMAPASAPAGTVAVIHECRAKGSLTTTLYAVVGFDDGLAIIIFGFAAALAKTLLITEASGAAEGILGALLAPAKEIGLSFVVGGVAGLLFYHLVRRLQSARDILIVVFGVILICTGLSIRWHLSLILTNMVVGFVLANARHESLLHRVTAPLLEVMPLLFVLFFCLAGVHLQLSALPALGAVGIIYVLGRSAGLIGGARIGALLGHVEDKVKKYVGLGILSQAGVAIGLSLIVKHEFTQLDAEFTQLDARYNAPHALAIGSSVLATITATCIFFEIIGPIMTKFALKRAGEIPDVEPK